ncbi:NTP transferase domain-containing protein, partial [Intestinimonas massiliensis]|uniref:nucleotidyltransferase family protein n=1 Tax=Intestinimonas massiliensis (ex Afouda et al. 2020) TaxID=1673721 RepID=UPI00210AF98F
VQILHRRQAQGDGPGLAQVGKGIFKGVVARLGGQGQDLDGALFAVCDQPWLTTESIKRLLNSFRESPDCICALSWGGKRGNPALFPREFYPELFALTGDAGGGA